MTLTQIAPTFWGSYGASLVALLGFLVNGILTYGAAQKLAGQREEQRIADQEWKKEHTAQANCAMSPSRRCRRWETAMRPR